MILNGTSYKASPELAQIIERCRLSGKRFRFHLGDPESGQAWGDVDIGKIGRSVGPVKIPIVLSNRRSMGGHGLLDHCVIMIEHANKSDGGVVWKHPTYQTNEIQ
jgi:hypothetical protein